MKNGPIVSLIPIHKDFLVYTDGIYKVKISSGKMLGLQAVKIVGWNDEDKTPYWIVENSWGNEWGINGYAHID